MNLNYHGIRFNEHDNYFVDILGNEIRVGDIIAKSVMAYHSSSLSIYEVLEFEHLDPFATGMFRPWANIKAYNHSAGRRQTFPLNANIVKVMVS